MGGIRASMNTDYFAWRNWRCPILLKCLRQMRAMCSTDLFRDLETDIESLEDLLDVCSADPSYVRLRGFIIIEEMVSTIKTIYESGYRTNVSPQFSLQLACRSWGGLSLLKRTLEELTDEVEVEIAENQLGGVKYAAENVVFISNKVADAAETAQRVTIATHLSGLVKIAKHSIVVLRPYLKNEQSPIAILGDEAAFFLREGYHDAALEPLLSLTRKI